MKIILLITTITVIVCQTYGDTCTMSTAERKDCGDVTTTPDGCRAKGCCWEVTTDKGRPNCFYKKSDGATTQSPTPGDKKVFIHMMPWFETKASNGGKWGIHWTMANKNPDNYVNGKRDIAAYYHPLIDVYASGDAHVIDWQLGLMKLSGVTGVLIDWPGTAKVLDYTGNARNAEAIIAGTQRHGLEFGIVYEDHNLGMCHDQGLIKDIIAQGKADMQYIKDNFFSKANYAKVNGTPILLDFGPQTLQGKQWNDVFTPFTQKPNFYILSDKAQSTAGSTAKGGFAWIWPNFMDGLNSFYHSSWSLKFGCVYPGFNAFYKDGGWGDIPWKIPYSVDTFTKTLDLALVSVDHIQVVTWNDYGEGTIIEPTLEMGYQFLTTMQKKLGVNHNQSDLEQVTKIFFGKKKFANNATVLAQLKKQHFDLVMH